MHNDCNIRHVSFDGAFTDLQSDPQKSDHQKNALERQFACALFKLGEHGLERGRVRAVRELHGGDRGARLVAGVRMKS